MPTMFLTLNLFCAMSFLGFGVGCVVSVRMVREFTRYKLPRFRVLIGVLQILGGIGLLAGLRVPEMGALAAAGLALLMLLGFGVRLKIRDGFLLSSPAFLYMLLSAWLCSEFLGQMVT